MTRASARLTALGVAAVVLLTTSALARFALVEAERVHRLEARRLGETLVAEAEHRIAELSATVHAFARATAEASPPTPIDGAPAAQQDRTAIDLWSSRADRWSAARPATDPDGRLARALEAALAASGAEPPQIGPVLDRGTESILFVRLDTGREAPEAVAGSQPLNRVFAPEILRAISERGYDYRIRERRAKSPTASAPLQSGWRRFEQPESLDLRVLDRAWQLELEPRDGWRGRGRAAFAQSVLAALLALCAGLAAHVFVTRPPRDSAELDTLRTRVGDLSAQLDLALDDFERVEDRLKQEAHFDPGTGLPNRRAFVTAIDAGMRRVRREVGRGLAVASLSFVGLVRLRDSLGREAGEQLIREAAGRLGRVIGPEEALGRVGDAEIGLTLLDVDDADQARRRATQLQQAFAQPFRLSGQEVFMSAAVGIARSSSGFEPGEQLLGEAALSLGQALEGDSDYVRLFDPATRDEAVSALRLESRLRRAIEDEVPQPFFQPIVAASDRRIVGMEVLVRWFTEAEGMIRPDHFIPLAEETGLVVPLDRLVLRRAARQIHAWRQTLPESYPFYVSVNLSAYDLREPDVCDYIKGVLDELELPTSAIRLELTESAIIGNVSRMIQIVAQLRSMGFKVLLDDFGTGYSSLSYLHKFQFDVLKIDQSFVRELGREGREHDIVRAIVSLASALDLQVVAEGVETEEQFALLKEIGCDYCQGYLFSKPVDGDEAGTLLFDSVRAFPCPTESVGSTGAD